MKRPLLPLNSRLRRPARGRRGVALIAVLAVLVLLTLLVVAFLIRAQSARNSSVGYRTTTATRLLSDTVVNLVEAEINDATTTARNNTWASQPGAIRAFDNNGNLVSIYRLYSAPSLTATAASQLANDLPPTTWASSPSVWTDLNAPVTVVGMTDTTGKAVTNFQIYPILDNRDPIQLASGTVAPVQIPGFYVNTVNGGSTFPNQSTTTQLLKWNQPYMPVQWLYVVKNGSIIAPDQPATGSSVTFNNVAAANAPSASNPIVGRIAFWTDDETCKLNINTAAGSESLRQDSSGAASILPAPWESPKFAIWDELKLFSRNQPVHGEYQRYPGHPATTDLFPVLSGAGANQSANLQAVVPSAYGLGLNFGTGSNNTTFPTTSSVYGADNGNGTTPSITSNTPDPSDTPYFALLPRYNDDHSSKGGSYNTTASTTANTAPLPGSLVITTKRNRLYTSVGEFLYAQANAASRTRNTDGNASPLTRQQIETGKFFLTAHNRAPEVTLFGTPRIPMWPIDSDYTTNGNNSQYLSTFDKVIAFCSSYGAGSAGAKNNYFIQRHDATSPINDYNNIPRNKRLFSYLQTLTSANIPGFGGNFSSKYSTNGEINQILTEMIDYIRCANTYDWSMDTTGALPRYTGGSSGAAIGQIVPLQIGTSPTYRGLGRIYTISESGILVICTADGNNSLVALQSGATNGTNPPTNNTNPNYTSTGNSATSVVYNPPASVTGIGMVSPVIGSATDPKYASNLPVAQFLRLATTVTTGPPPTPPQVKFVNGDDGNPGVIVDMFGTTVTSANAASCTPFPANQTLTTTGVYGGPLAAVSPNQKKLQAMMLFELSNPMLGFNFTTPNLILNVSNLESLTFSPATTSNPFPSTADGALSKMQSRLNMVDECGGEQGFQYTIATSANTSRTNGWNPSLGTGSNTYKYVSNPFTVTSTGNLTFGGGPITVQLLVPDKTTPTNNNTAQTFNLTFPTYTTPMPDLIQYGLTSFSTSSSPITNAFNFSAGPPPSGPTIPNSNPADWWGFDNRIAWADLSQWAWAVSTSATGKNPSNTYLGPASVIRTDVAALPTSGWTYVNPGKYYPAGLAAPQTNAPPVPSSFPGLLSVSGYTSAAPAGNRMTGLMPSVFYRDITGATNATSALPPSDVVRTVVAFAGDTRLEVAKSTVTADTTSTADMIPHPVYYDPGGSSVKLADSFMEAGNGGTTTPGVDLAGSLYPGAQYEAQYAPKALNYSGFGLSNSGTLTPTNTWDWDSGLASYADGAYANKPDEGNTYDNKASPYYNGQSAGTVTVSYFSANRIMPSPVMFGSLPTGVTENIPWKTLLFRPGYSTDGGVTYKHPSAGIPSAGIAASTVPTPPYATPPDELLLDLFDMPVVEPYAISEPFSTAGKVNMNYQIVPFTYITRDTAVRAVLGSEMIPRVPLGSESSVTGTPQVPWYKNGPSSQIPVKPVGSPNSTNTHNVTMMRIPLDVTSDYATTTSTKSENNGTLAQFQQVFTNGDIFRSPAQICDIYLVPRGVKGTDYGDSPSNYDINNYVWPNFGNLWYGSDFAMVGDNARERPYADIYSRLTTKSNTFTVHYRVQTLANPPAANQAQWSEAAGVVTGEYRGSTTLERYLDPNDTTIPDYAGDSSPLTDKSLDSCYQWRTVSNTAFAP